MILSQKKDIVIWIYSGNLYHTRECYNLLEGNDGIWESNWKKIRGMTIPPKIQIFVWEMELGVIPSLDFLKERLRLNIDHRCRYCKLHIETSMHIFKECRIVINFWEKVSHWWSLSRL